MVKINIADIAKKRGLSNAYKLQNALRCSPTMASRLWKGTFKQIAVETIDRLCDLLDCEPSDFIVYVSDKPKAKKPVKRPETSETAIFEGGLLTTAQVAERLSVEPRTVRDYYHGKSGGKLPFVKIGTKSFVRESDLRTFIAERNGQAEQVSTSP